MEFLKSHPEVSKTPIKPAFDFVKRLLRNPKYTGYFAYPKWDIPVQRWKMDAIISLDTFQAIQDRLSGKRQTKPTKYNLKDERYPLRRWVRCSGCGKPLKGSASRNKVGKYYAYYHCDREGCVRVKPEVIHADFENLLIGITPGKPIIALTERIVQECYDEMTEDERRSLNAKRVRLEGIEDEKQQLLQTIIKTKNDEVRDMCEARMTELATEKTMLEEALKSMQENEIPFPEALAYCMRFFSSPREIWITGDYHQKRGVLDLCFSEPLSYHKELKFGTPCLSPICAIFEENHRKKEDWREIVSNLKTTRRADIIDIAPYLVKFKDKVMAGSEGMRMMG